MTFENIEISYSVRVHPGNVSGQITAPASKSSMQRAAAAALVSGGKSIIENPGISNDDQASVGVIEALGATVRATATGALEVDATVLTTDADQEIKVHFGESGLGIRMFTSIAALRSGLTRIEGQGSLTSRPMDFFDQTLPQLGVSIKSNQGKLPLEIKGPLVPQNITIDGSLSSQFLTGLLLAYSAADARDVTITVSNLKSRPYVDLTLKVMADFGLKLPQNNNYESFYFGKQEKPTNQATTTYQVEGDWSGGAFLLVAGAIKGPITVKGLDPVSTQADKAILQALQQSGCQLSVEQNQIQIGPATGPLKAFQFDATDCPDLFPPLVALAAYCEGKSVIQGVTRLAHKESNRALTLQEEFAKLGVQVLLQDDLMIIEGGGIINGNTATHSRHDHRIAMAAAVAALGADGPVEIQEAAAVKKSYPNFYQHLANLGVTLSY
ncbi:3-phosphoshikimate 1-carboxyvinyltransferase [Arachidicoccus rhizosphaerae]|uniref:3-phosphoshikimate 1-carboxyvinyltransferase n=1 Tax=Arachidicoccus rhizosphaerae TaxID=551991 RepID=A0A1H3W9U9_9BACT|nr:3-phosphoshikimate 1-carboxyvinyltransferase [Arachidicoccus rhizosphaerae]SDZ83194.1 3-phosphoshikimate 1-carboxyvinyltransferase [Arachidicoccus rhizosphaerae]